MQKYEIRNRWTGNVMFCREGESLRDVVAALVKSNADMRDADMSNADMRDADMRDADMRDADMRNANMRNANMSRANMRNANMHNANMSNADMSDANMSNADMSYANIRGADMRNANMRNANMSRANMRNANMHNANMSNADMSDANMSNADMRGANMRGANLSGVDMSGANLTPIRDDIWAVLSSSPAEAAGLLQSIRDGRIDGSVYEGDCACLVGTLANLRNCNYQSIPGLAPDGLRPAERFFLAINPGDTPENSQFANLASQWIGEWLERTRATFAAAPAAVQA